MKKDIENRNDIECLVDLFYKKVRSDDMLGLIFNEIAKINWASHLPVMYAFWENAVLFTGNYAGNPMHLHEHLHHIRPLHAVHFERWNELFISAVDELFEGEKAILAKQRALSISTVIQSQLLKSQADSDNIY